MLAQAVGCLGAEVKHLSPAAQDEKLVDFVRCIGKPGIWFDKFCVVRFVKAVNRKRLRIASHEVVAQLPEAFTTLEGQLDELKKLEQ